MNQRGLGQEDMTAAGDWLSTKHKLGKVGPGWNEGTKGYDIWRQGMNLDGDMLSFQWKWWHGFSAVGLHLRLKIRNQQLQVTFDREESPCSVLARGSKARLLVCVPGNQGSWEEGDCSAGGMALRGDGHNSGPTWWCEELSTHCLSSAGFLYLPAAWPPKPLMLHHAELGGTGPFLLTDTEILSLDFVR